MKRMVLIAAIAFSVISCAQHDSKSPDTSGNDPQNPNSERPVTTGDTTSPAGNNNNYMGGSGGNNMNNDGSNNNQAVNTGDSSLDKNRQKQ